MSGPDQDKSEKEDPENGFTPSERIITRYEKEWRQLYQDLNLGESRQRALDGCLATSRFRSVYWRVFLGAFSDDTSNWLAELKMIRAHYRKISCEFNVEPWTHSDNGDNPLNQSDDSSWNQHFSDLELKRLIELDVRRTHLGYDFFDKDSVRKAMLNILFVYARENPKMRYTQGMNEILAMIMFVLHCDHQALLRVKENGLVSHVINKVLDPEFIEADAYTIFGLVLNAISTYYKIYKHTLPGGYVPFSLDDPMNETENEIIVELEYIKENILVPIDKELADHLNRLGIHFTMFGIRMLRLLFGREFPLSDVFLLWDAIFAENKDCCLVPYVMIAMLIAIRKKLLSSKDDNECLTLLMKYPESVKVKSVIQKALLLKNSMKCCKIIESSQPQVSEKITGTIDLHSVSPSHSGHMSMFSKSSEKSPMLSGKSRTSSGTSFSDRIKKFSTKPGQRSTVKPHRTVPVRAETDAPSSATVAGSGIVEGFPLNDPSVLISELRKAKSVMSLCSFKLAQYRSILAETVNSLEHPEVMQALDGMNELCNLLNNETRKGVPPEIEPAYEAGESRVEPLLHTTVQPAAFGATSQHSVTPPQHSILPPSQLLRQSPDIWKKEMEKGVGTSIKCNSMNIILSTYKVSVVEPSVKDFPLPDPLKCMKERNHSDTTEDHSMQDAFFALFSNRDVVL